MLTASAAIHQEQWFTTSIDDDTLLAVSAAGYSSDVPSLEWFKHLNGLQQNGNRVYIVYFCLADCTKEFLDFCGDHKIIPLCPPPHTTHILHHSTSLPFNPIRISTPKQLMWPHALDARTSTNSSSSQHSHQSGNRHSSKLQCFPPSDRPDCSV